MTDPAQSPPTANEAAGAAPSEPTWDELDAIIRNTSTIDIAARAWTAERELSAARQRIEGLEAELRVREGLYRDEWTRANVAESRLAAVEAERSKERDAIRLATIEECARVCDERSRMHITEMDIAAYHEACLDLSDLIRHLKEKS